MFSLGRGKRFFTSTEENKLDLFIGTKAVAYADNTRLDDYYSYAVLSSQFGKGRHKFTLDQLYKEYFSRASLLTTGTGGMSYYTEINTQVNYEAEFHRLGYELGYTSDILDYAGQYKGPSSFHDQTFITTIYLRPQALPKTRFLLEFDYGWNDYTKSGSVAKNSIYKNYWRKMYPKPQDNRCG